jgi:hypothetical protein
MKRIFYFVVHNRNHVRLLAPIAERIQPLAQVVFVELEDIHYREGARDALRNHPFRVISAAEFDKSVSSGALIVVCNDWAPGGLIEILDRARAAGATMVGLVEGCRFAMPHRYQRVNHVFALGRSSLGLFKQPTRIVGSPVVEAAAWDEKFCRTPAFVAINYKFTYDALDRRDEWLSTAILACKQAGIGYALSQHPSDRYVHPTHPFQPLDHLLREAAVLVTRSSTTVYEALARCKPVVLFPVEGENLFEFADPQGAFSIAYHPECLADLLNRALHTTEIDIAAGQKFLHRHIRIGQRGDAIRLIANNLIELGECGTPLD